MQQRSTFVSVVGWIFIVLSGLGMLQCLMFMFLPMDKFMAAAQLQAPAGQPVPDPAVMASFMHTMVFIFFVVEAWVLLSSIGLVMRKGWARISFIVICSISAFFSVIYVLVGLLGRSVQMDKVPNATPAMADFMHSMMTIMAVMGAVFAALFIFIIYKLCTQKIAQEFLPQSGS
jgi:hypothetical protein